MNTQSQTIIILHNPYKLFVVLFSVSRSFIFIFSCLSFVCQRSTFFVYIDAFLDNFTAHTHRQRVIIIAVLTDDLKRNFDGPILKWFSENWCAFLPPPIRSQANTPTPWHHCHRLTSSILIKTVR